MFRIRFFVWVLAASIAAAVVTTSAALVFGAQTGTRQNREDFTIVQQNTPASEAE